MFTALPRASNRYTNHDSRQRSRYARRKQNSSGIEGRPLCELPKAGSDLSRPQLLEILKHDINEEEKAAETLFFSFDLHDCQYNASGETALKSNRSPSAVQVRPATVYKNNSDVSLATPTMDISIPEIALYGKSKDCYLSTPVRKRYFPTLSPGLLKDLLSTPPIREATPDYKSLAEDLIFPLAADTSLIMPGGLISLDIQADQYAENPTYAEKDTVDVASAWREDISLLSSGCQTDLVYPLTPPLSSHLPNVQSFSPTGTEADASVVYAHQAAISGTPLDYVYRSKEDVRSPIALETATLNSTCALDPSRQLRSARSDLHMRMHRDVTATLQQRAQGTLSFNALRNYQRVINELQGAEPKSSALDPAENSDSVANISTIPGLSSCSSDCSMDLSGTQQDLDGSSAGTLSNAKPKDPNTSTDSMYFCPPKEPKYLDIDPNTLQEPRESVSSLNDEFVALLLHQAATEEAQVIELRLLATRLERMVVQRRQLATLMKTAA